LGPWREGSGPKNPYRPNMGWRSDYYACCCETHRKSTGACTVNKESVETVARSRFGAANRSVTAPGVAPTPPTTQSVPHCTVECGLRPMRVGKELQAECNRTIKHGQCFLPSCNDQNGRFKCLFSNIRAWPVGPVAGPGSHRPNSSQGRKLIFGSYGGFPFGKRNARPARKKGQSCQ